MSFRNGLVTSPLIYHQYYKLLTLVLGGRAGVIDNIFCHVEKSNMSVTRLRLKARFEMGENLLSAGDLHSLPLLLNTNNLNP